MKKIFVIAIVAIVMAISTMPIMAKTFGAPNYDIVLPSSFDDNSAVYAALLNYPSSRVAYLTKGDNVQIMAIICDNDDDLTIEQLVSKYLRETPGSYIVQEESNMVNKCVIRSSVNGLSNYIVILMDDSQSTYVPIFFGYDVFNESFAESVINNYLKKAKVVSHE